MLQVLCGSKNTQKILLFLFVNSKCYGTQLHRLLKTPLTPIQKALLRLERGGVILSDYEGKTRIYQFNPAFPLLGELEQLLKRAYTLLPPQEKKQYSVMKEDKLKRLSPEAQERVLLTIWERLGNVGQLTFHAKTKSKDEGGWNGKGNGEVLVTKEGENVLLFHEKGTWQGKKAGEVNFSNLFRWTLDRETLMISLEHLRRGYHHPVFLFHLSCANDHSLSSTDSHLCGGDAYFGQIFCNQHYLRLNWRVIGPKKNEEMDYFYS